MHVSYVYVSNNNDVCLRLLILPMRQQRCVQYNIKIHMWRCSICVYIYMSMYHIHRYSVRRFLTWEVYRSPVASKTRTQTTYSSWGRTDFLGYPDLGYTDGGCTIRKGWIFCPSKSHFTFYKLHIYNYYYSCSRYTY